MKEYTGKTLEDLLATAAKDKNVTVEELSYYVKEEKKGFLGLGNQVIADVYCRNDVDDFIENYIKTFFTSLNLKVDVEIDHEDEGFRIMLNAENNAIIIGKNGQTLEAINTVVRGAVNSHFKRRFHILIDINNYKIDRYDKIKGIAYRVARSVQKSHVAATLDPMTADERRVVHNFLNDMEFIRTESEGEGKNRRLKIMYDAKKN